MYKITKYRFSPTYCTQKTVSDWSDEPGLLGVSNKRPFWEEQHLLLDLSTVSFFQIFRIGAKLSDSLCVVKSKTIKIANLSPLIVAIKYDPTKIKKFFCLIFQISIVHTSFRHRCEFLLGSSAGIRGSMQLQTIYGYPFRAKIGIDIGVFLIDFWFIINI